MTQPLLRLCESPHLCVLPDLLSGDEAATLAALARDDDALAAAGIEVLPDGAGRKAELPLSLHPLLEAVADRIEAAMGLRNRLGERGGSRDDAEDGARARAQRAALTLRMRHYRQGEGHPPQVDTYEIDGWSPVATALVGLEIATKGGETVFPAAHPAPVALTVAPGQLVCWRNLSADGSEEASARHVAAPVEKGDKIVLSWFIYADLGDLPGAMVATRAPTALRDAARARRPLGALRGLGRLLAIIDDGVPAESVELLQDAAEARGVTCVRVDPRRFDFGAQRVLRPGDLVFRPAVSMHSIRVEHHLWQPGVGSFYLDPAGPLFSNINALTTFARAGLPVPRTFALFDGDRDLMRHYVEQLGGLPVVLKALGHSRGVGTIRADSLASLFSIVDYALVEGTRPLLTAWVPDAVHWRLVVVGDRVVSTYRNVMDDDDFRTSGSSDPHDYAASPPEGAAALAIAACRALRHAHGGVDILAHPSGRLYLLEANFPCYYATGQLEAGHNVAGAMVDYLLDDAARHAPASDEPWPDLAPRV